MSDNIQTKIEWVEKLMQSILEKHGGFSLIPFNSNYWSLRKDLAKLKMGIEEGLENPDD